MLSTNQRGLVSRSSRADGDVEALFLQFVVRLKKLTNQKRPFPRPTIIKAKKPLMEKMRRKRINESLNELKSLILEALNKDASRYSKMEKADVLEMTVHYLRERKRLEQKHQALDTANFPEFRANYVQCTAEIARKMTSLEANDELRENFLAHLASRCQGNGPTAVPVFSTESLRFMAPLKPVMIPFPSPPPSPLQVSPVLSASSGGLTRDLSPASTCRTRDTGFNFSSRQQQPRHMNPAQSTNVWRPW